MNIQFTTVQVPIPPNALTLFQEIEGQLSLQGEPLRWAITGVEDGVALIEAVVLQSSTPAGDGLYPSAFAEQE
ncbi:MAG: hypothetical protein MH252_21440 [Thermosynechococcaceae cyanobacterium MS004]|nr:hypothetical protein [Thermosynechococcaceae cyanobacterium MS004]